MLLLPWLGSHTDPIANCVFRFLKTIIQLGGVQYLRTAVGRQHVQHRTNGQMFNVCTDWLQQRHTLTSRPAMRQMVKLLRNRTIVGNRTL